MLVASLQNPSIAPTGVARLLDRFADSQMGLEGAYQPDCNFIDQS